MFTETSEALLISRGHFILGYGNIMSKLYTNSGQVIVFTIITEGFDNKSHSFCAIYFNSRNREIDVTKLTNVV